MCRMCIASESSVRYSHQKNSPCTTHRKRGQQESLSLADCITLTWLVNILNGYAKFCGQCLLLQQLDLSMPCLRAGARVMIGKKACRQQGTRAKDAKPLLPPGRGKEEGKDPGPFATHYYPFNCLGCALAAYSSTTADHCNVVMHTPS